MSKPSISSQTSHFGVLGTVMYIPALPKRKPRVQFDETSDCSDRLAACCEMRPPIHFHDHI
jgi:hypothetical protein